MKASLFSALLALSSFFGASSASAELVRVTYTGTVGNGYDETGLFGQPQSYLDGESYQATFLYNTNGRFDYKSYGTDTIFSSGGYPYGPFVLATTTINGHSVRVPGGEVGSLNWNDSGELLGSSAYYAMYSGLAQMVDAVTANSSTFPIPTDTGLDYTVLPTDSQYAIFNFNGIIPGVPLSFVNAHGTGVISTVTISVPEPSTWAMMLLGFAGLGFAGYRASRRTAA